MSIKIEIRHSVTEQPSLAENQVGRIPVKEGKNLPSSIEEDIGSFSLCLHYSRRQLREINRRLLKKRELSMGKPYKKIRQMSKRGQERLIVNEELSGGDLDFDGGKFQ